ncbi:hypothetical protein FG446_004327, partial [Yersinia enterocolitica]|nr:hypothetical protein [Yersinia enterocolitica]EKN4849943.1 hypothetical protein [Yersinia enterocolitica]EKN5999797.1 hypothetical protein [Yersinia enterocolitica]
MNYVGYKALRGDVAALANTMCDLRATLNGLEAKYSYQEEALAVRLVGQTLHRINALYLEAYREVLVLDE